MWFKILRLAIPVVSSAVRRGRATAFGEPKGDAVEALATIAAAQRADLASTAAITATLVGVTAAYFAGTLFYEASLVARLGWGTALLPLPIWIVAAFAALSNIAMRHRLLVIGIAERRVLEANSAPTELTEVWAIADDTMEWNKTLRPHRMAIGLMVAVVVLALLGYTWVMGHAAPDPLWFEITVFAVYLGILGITAWSLASGSKTVSASIRRLERA
jgi:hypothetical protein